MPFSKLLLTSDNSGKDVQIGSHLVGAGLSAETLVEVSECLGVLGGTVAHEARHPVKAPQFVKNGTSDPDVRISFKLCLVRRIVISGPQTTGIVFTPINRSPDISLMTIIGLTPMHNTVLRANMKSI